MSIRAEPKAAGLSRSRLRSSGVQELIALVIMLALIILVMSRGTSLFLTPRNITNLLLDTTTVSIIAVFTTMLMISRGLDLSVASTAALCGVIIGSMQQIPGLWTGVLTALGVGALVGFINGFLVTYIGINPLIATLGMLSIARGLAFVIANGLTIPVFDRTGEQTQIYEAFTQLSEGTIAGIPIPILVAVGLFVIGIVVLRYTTYGRAMYMIGDNEEAAYLAGLPVRRYRMTAYILSGLSAAVAAVFLTSRLYAADPNAAPNIELTVITAVVLGGTSLAGGQGNLVGTLLGVLVLSSLLNGMRLQSVSTEMQNIAQGLVLLLAVGIDQVRQGKIQFGLIRVFRRGR
ncbi:ABC transporter permease [Geitlerinema calcuttense]|uniref:ABC transporter permease n=1 Tax=Geitlerinema calcuttense NRMC-F 0142 TaxID=2922238 RepID=A0ABT7LW37_9CYAN|nr:MULTISPECIES: ABC transporter permease [Cyanophyceae]MDL5055304.1 ABC transporter permease [Oscillatoria laete-virens NRMC-F 0139]MDL5056209.1 ABC transporter permease [Geitlerinema calcuttense NRMC-F 0142]